MRDVFRLFRSLNDTGLSILLVEQNTALALETADYGYVLQLGRVVAEDDTSALMHSEEIVNAYLGDYDNTVPPPTKRKYFNEAYCIVRGTAVMICGLGFGKASAQDLMLGYLAANTGPFSSLARRNAVAIELAIDDINAKGGVNGKKLTLSSFDTGGKPEQAVAGVSHFAQDLPVLAVIGPFSTSECRVAFPAGERLAIPEMSMASSAPKVAAPYTYDFRNTTDEAYTFERLFQTVKAKNIPHASASIAYATDDAVSQSLGTAVLPAALKNADIPVLETVSFRVAAFYLAPEVSQIMQKPPISFRSARRRAPPSSSPNSAVRAIPAGCWADRLSPTRSFRRGWARTARGR